jgi:hypothetical protein
MGENCKEKSMVWSENALTRRQTHKKKARTGERETEGERKREREAGRRRRRKRAPPRETGDSAFPSLWSAAM